MCAAHILATRELYLVFMRLLCSFRLEAHGSIDYDPKKGSRNPKDLIMAPIPYEIVCVPRNEQLLRQALADHKLE